MCSQTLTDFIHPDNFKDTYVQKHCTSLKNPLQTLLRQCTFGPLLFDFYIINSWTVMGPINI